MIEKVLRIVGKVDRKKLESEVYKIVSEIPFGCVVTYGQLARLAGFPKCARMVGYAMAHAPEESSLPCHRVVNSQGRIAPNWPEQKTLLEQEGICFKTNGCVDLRKYMWKEINYLDE